MRKRVIVGLADALVDVWRRLQLPFTRALAVETSFAKAAIAHPSQGKIVQEVLGPIWIEQRGGEPAPPPRRRAEDALRSRVLTGHHIRISSDSVTISHAVVHMRPKMAREARARRWIRKLGAA